MRRRRCQRQTLVVKHVLRSDQEFGFDGAAASRAPSPWLPAAFANGGSPAPLKAGGGSDPAAQVRLTSRFSP